LIKLSAWRLEAREFPTDSYTARQEPAGELMNFQEKMRANHINGFNKVVGMDFTEIYNKVRHHTMLSPERLYDLYLSRKYVESASIPGDVLEIGVFRGGAIGMSLLASSSSRLHIGIDNFVGHSEPSLDEFDLWGNSMQERWSQETQGGKESWPNQQIESTHEFLTSLNSASPFKLIKKDIIELDTQDLSVITNSLAILRVDVDWYPETLKSLEVFWPLLSVGGVLILDDYGHHSGARKACDEFFADYNLRFIHVDYSCITTTKV